MRHRKTLGSRAAHRFGRVLYGNSAGRAAIDDSVPLTSRHILSAVFGYTFRATSVLEPWYIAQSSSSIRWLGGPSISGVNGFEFALTVWGKSLKMGLIWSDVRIGPAPWKLGTKPQSRRSGSLLHLSICPRLRYNDFDDDIPETGRRPRASLLLLSSPALFVALRALNSLQSKMPRSLLKHLIYRRLG